MPAHAAAPRGLEGSERARFGVFGVGPHLIGLPIERIEEMYVMPAVHRRPGASGSERGVVNLRGSALPAFDLRVTLGLAPAAAEVDELVQLLVEREQDHRRWLDELEASVRERRPFTLSIDPRQCKFGQWYYAFQTEDAVLRAELARIEAPHAEIHALGATVEELKQQGRHERALALVAERRVSLGQLVALFDQIRRTIRQQHREIGVTTTSRAGERRVVVVDSAEAVADLELFPDRDDPFANGDLSAELVTRVARWPGSSRPVLLLDLGRVTRVTAGPGPVSPSSGTGR